MEKVTEVVANLSRYCLVTGKSVRSVVYIPPPRACATDVYVIIKSWQFTVKSAVALKLYIVAALRR